MLSSITSDGLTINSLLIASSVSLLLGFVVAGVYTKTANNYTKHFATTLVLLPILVQIVMMMVNGNLGTGIAIMGAFSLVRFRSIPGTSREIVGVFFAMSLGLATGTGYVGFAVFAAVSISFIMFVMKWTNIFEQNVKKQLLKITMPEDVNHEEVLEPVFEKHQLQPILKKVKTKNMGSLYELTYEMEMSETINKKQFLDDLRIRNGNLAIVLFEKELDGGL